MISVGAVLAGAVAVGCIEEYTGPGAQAGSPFTDEDAGTGYELDLAGEDFAGMVLAGKYHPVGWKEPPSHGLQMKWQVQDCRTCHGQDLTGGVAGAGGAGTAAPPSCDSCHKQGWRTDCTYCHGTPGGNGNPPRDIDGQTDPNKIRFPAHIAHVSGRITPSLDCIQCHRKPIDVLTPYHAFDASPRRGENNLSAGLSTVGVYDPVLRRCTNLYCHGTGRGSNGTMDALTTGPLACSACHAGIDTPATWPTMGGDHNRHLTGGNAAQCTDCHAKTLGAGSNLIGDKALHINGKPEVDFGGNAAGMTWNAADKTCTGTCHNKPHDDKDWYDD
jgi:predicted CxxxxCH...CXXCH cytochrome family protein